jgi:hypothetical protein
MMKKINPNEVTNGIDEIRKNGLACLKKVCDTNECIPSVVEREREREREREICYLFLNKTIQN